MGAAHEAIREGRISRVSALNAHTANEFCTWVRKFHSAEDLDCVTRDICTLRSLFYRDMLEEG
ncbi:MAG: hypothetical protein HFH80_07525 [Lachnospiraceae bacterium]|nr:hypothetical protein [Lachnospiraceae bacterium]